MDPRTQASPPPAAQLEAAALELSRRGELRLLVSMVERWGQVGVPTHRARLKQIEALLDLRVMDRAWTRLQAVPEDIPEALDRWKLTARMFVDRGWPNRAREAVEQAQQLAPDDAQVAELVKAVLAPPRSPPAGLPPAEAPLAERLAVAEALLSCGAFLKGRRMLEVLDQESPGNTRVSDLLWALQGEYDLAGTSLQQVASHYGSGRAVARDREDTDPTIPGGLTRSSGTSGAFPALFRGLEPVDQADMDAETTVATRLEDLRASHSLPDLDKDDDTAVLRVVGGDGADPVAEDPAKVGPVEDLEEEDDVVVLVRRRELQAPPETRRPKPLPAPAPRSERKAKTAPALAELMEMAQLETLDELEPIDDLESIDDLEAVDGPPAPRDDTAIWLLAAAVVLGVVGIALGWTAYWVSTHPPPL